MKKAKLGDRVIDTVTSFTGIVVSKHSYLEGCDRLTVQPGINAKGSLPETECFDAPRLKVIKKEFTRGDTSIGGPSRYEDRER